MMPHAAKDQTIEHYEQLAGVSVLFHVSGALYLPDTEAVVFADLHFEKGSSYARKGIFLPPYDTRRTLKDMKAVIEMFKPRSVISLGDAFHDKQSERRMSEEDATTLETFVSEHDWIWILGNHDPLPPARFAGRVFEELELGGLFFSHEPSDHHKWQVVGHMHPAAKVSRNGRSIRRRCFMTDGEKLIMPAFGAYTGGLNILDDAYNSFFSNNFQAYLLGEDQVWQVPRKLLKADR